MLHLVRPPTAAVPPSEVARFIADRDLPAIAAALEAGTDPNGCSGYGNPLLVCSICFEIDRANNGDPLDVSATSLLLTHGADPFRRHRGTERPWDTAVTVRHWLAVELFTAVARCRNIPIARPRLERW